MSKSSMWKHLWLQGDPPAQQWSELRRSLDFLVTMFCFPCFGLHWRFVCLLVMRGIIYKNQIQYPIFTNKISIHEKLSLKWRPACTNLIIEITIWKNYNYYVWQTANANEPVRTCSENNDSLWQTKHGLNSEST